MRDMSSCEFDSRWKMHASSPSAVETKPSVGAAQSFASTQGFFTDDAQRLETKSCSAKQLTGAVSAPQLQGQTNRPIRPRPATVHSLQRQFGSGLPERPSTAAGSSNKGSHRPTTPLQQLVVLPGEYSSLIDYDKAKISAALSWRGSQDRLRGQSDVPFPTGLPLNIELPHARRPRPISSIPLEARPTRLLPIGACSPTMASALAASRPSLAYSSHIPLVITLPLASEHGPSHVIDAFLRHPDNAWSEQHVHAVPGCATRSKESHEVLSMADCVKQDAASRNHMGHAVEGKPPGSNETTYEAAPCATYNGHSAPGAERLQLGTFSVSDLAPSSEQLQVDTADKEDGSTLLSLSFRSPHRRRHSYREDDQPPFVVDDRRLSNAVHSIVSAHRVFKHFRMASTKRDLIVAALRASPSFTSVPDLQLSILARAGMERRAPRYTVIYREGSSARSFYVLIAGRLQQSNIAGDRRAILSVEEGQPGICLGTESLAGGLMRVNTVTCLCECKIVHFDTYDTLEAAPGSRPSNRSRSRNDGVGGMAVSSFLVSVLTMNALRNVHVLEGVSEITIQRVTPLFNLEERAKGDHIFSQGAPSDQMLILFSGSVKVVHNGVEVVQMSAHPDQADGLPVFGEAALVDAAPRMASLVATAACHLLVLNKKNFRSFLYAVPDFKARLQNIAEFRKKQSMLTATINNSKKISDGEVKALQQMQQDSRSRLSKNWASRDAPIKHSLVTTWELEASKELDSDKMRQSRTTKHAVDSALSHMRKVANSSSPSARLSDYSVRN